MNSFTKTVFLSSAFSILPYVRILAFMLGITSASANSWSQQIKLESSFLNYQSSSIRDSAYTIGGQVKLNFLEKVNFLAGYRYSYVDALMNNPVSMEEIEEDLYYIGAQYHFYSDRVPGKYGIRMDAYYGEIDTFFTIVQQNGFQGKNRPPTSSTTLTLDNDFTIYNPVLSYTNYLKTFYFDFAFAFSDYGNFRVNQFSPAVGFAFNSRKDWILFRAHSIQQEKDIAKVYGENNTAIEVSLTHWPGLNAPLGLHAFGGSMLVGERLYALDPDTNQVFTFADLHKGSLSLFFQWQPTENVQILLQAGAQKFENKVADDRYASNYVYINLSQKW